jgi:DNA-binding NtrC family response regulator
MDDFEILFVDDDPAILGMVEEYLSHLKYRVSIADNGLKALDMIKDKNFDIVFSDFKMPDIDGLELLAVIKEYRPETEVIIVTGHGTMESAIQAMKFGSYDYLQKPFKLDILKIIIDRIVEEKKLKKENIILKTRVKERHQYDSLVGISIKMQEIYEIIDRMKNNSPNVLIQGESGTGKELVAHTIHKTSDRKENEFRSINCRSFIKAASDNGIFAKTIELFESSQAGTIFLDEISEFTPPMQADIIRAFEEKNMKPGGKAEPPENTVRVLAATNKNLKETIERNKLKKEFVECLNTVTIKMPPLSERKEDICLLINHFLHQFSQKNTKQILNVSPQTLDLLLRYNWPGNVIQLQNVIERAFALGVELIIDVAHLPSEIQAFGEISKSG